MNRICKLCTSDIGVYGYFYDHEHASASAKNDGYMSVLPPDVVWLVCVKCDHRMGKMWRKMTDAETEVYLVHTE